MITCIFLPAKIGIVVAVIFWNAKRNTFQRNTSSIADIFSFFSYFRKLFFFVEAIFYFFLDFRFEMTRFVSQFVAKISIKWAISTLFMCCSQWTIIFNDFKKNSGHLSAHLFILNTNLQNYIWFNILSNESHIHYTIFSTSILKPPETLKLIRFEAIN